MNRGQKKGVNLLRDVLGDEMNCNERINRKIKPVMYFTQFETSLINRQNTQSVSHSVRGTRRAKCHKMYT